MQLVSDIVKIFGICICIYILRGVLRSKMRSEWTFEDKIFLGMCYLVIAICSFQMFTVAIFGLFGYNQITSNIFFVPDIMNLMFAMSWMIFLDYLVYRNFRRIRRNIRISMLPIALLLLMDAIMVAMWIGASKGAISLLANGRYVFSYIVLPYECLEILLSAVYVVGAFIVVRDYQKKRMEPLFLRLDFFVFPWVLGMLALHLFGIDVMGFFDAIALLVTYKALKQRAKFLDYETRAYNEEFLNYFKKYLDIIKLQEVTAFVVKAPSHKKALLDIIKESMPQKSFVVRMNSGSFLIFSETMSKLAAELFMKSLQDAGLNHNPPIRLFINYHTKMVQETSSEFIDKILSSEE